MKYGPDPEFKHDMRPSFSYENTYFDIRTSTNLTSNATNATSQISGPFTGTNLGTFHTMKYVIPVLQPHDHFDSRM